MKERDAKQRAKNDRCNSHRIDHALHERPKRWRPHQIAPVLARQERENTPIDA